MLNLHDSFRSNEHCRRSCELSGQGVKGFSGSNCRRAIRLRVISIDASTGKRAAGVRFCLVCGKHRQYKVTNQCGCAVFWVAPGIKYCLIEMQCGRRQSEYHLCFTADGMMCYMGRRYCPCLIIAVQPENKISFMLRKIDALTKEPLGGAKFVLHDGLRIIAAASSDEQGQLRFFDIPPGEYRLLETQAPHGYENSLQEYGIIISADGTVLIDGIPAHAFSIPNTPLASPFYISFIKVAINRLGTNKKGTSTMAIPLQGATFELRDSGGVVRLTATSDALGIVALGNVSPGVYTLIEINTPAGFIPGGPYTVVVSDTGEITIDGTPLIDFEAENFPFPDFTFAKTDSVGNPLQDAVFALDDLSGTIQFATSTVDGSVTFFGVHPGIYLLSEETPPFGFLPDPTVYLVEVDANGNITIGGGDPTGFTVINEESGNLTFVKMDVTPQSQVPVIDPVRTGLIPVTGTGIPGSTITVTWPDASTTDVVVALDNTWTATPPEPLVVAETVSAVQATPNHLPSDAVAEPVQPTSEPPVINEVFAGDSALSGTGIPDSVVTITWPDGSNYNATVLGDNVWTAIPPAPFVLGQEISAVQATPGMLPGVPATIIVQQVSPVPGINEVHAGDVSVIGTGIAGSSISIDWPAGDPDTTTVGSYGTWLALSPETLTLGQEISATQTAPGMLTSAATTTTVVADVLAADADADTENTGAKA